MNELANQNALTKREPARSDGDRDLVEVIRDYISGGGYQPGDRLPPERHLINELNLSRGALRKALDTLEREGEIWRQVGKGTFVSHLPDTSTHTEVADLARQVTPLRMVRARLCIEPTIAREAAINASSEAIVRMRVAMDRAAAATNWQEYETQDDLFHRAIAEAADNVLLLNIFDTLNAVRRAVTWRTVKRETERPTENHSSFTEHTAIADAIGAHDPGAAFVAMRTHLGSVSARLFEEL